MTFSCSKNRDKPLEQELEYEEILAPDFGYNYEDIPLPNHYLTNSFPSNFKFQSAAVENDNTPENNKITNSGAFLGRMLFYEKSLSQNKTISCASCHKQSEGFSDSSVKSIGFDGKQTRRHSMGLTNARFYDSGAFFWDERAQSLEEQVLLPFQDPTEMGMTLEELVSIVQEKEYSEALFLAAFGDSEISTERIAKALAQFIRSLVSINSKYDQARALVDNPMEDFPIFSAEENQGKRLFFNGKTGAPPCATCHQSEAFIGPQVPDKMSTGAANNGLSIENEDFGIYETSINNGIISRDRGKFKINSLRNVAISPPFMHDGRFSTLEQVLDHYSEGIQDVKTLHLSLRDDNGIPVKYNFSQTEKQALIAFLKTLTDEVLTTDEKFSNPFD
ncbi:MAG: cytochrome-c peroxidase [Flavobacteriaceae bacterium]